MELHIDALRRLSDRALSMGAERQSTMRISWEIAGKCSDPWPIEVHARPEAVAGQRDVIVAPGGQHPLELTIHAPCRKCEACLRYRAAFWRDRARVETAWSVRTWFATLTLHPDAQYRALALASVEAAKAGLEWEALKPEEQFRRRCKVIAPEITLFFKRVRKYGAPARYICVSEPHKSGAPHYHALIHEPTLQPLPYRVLKDAWWIGHAAFKLVKDDTSASYVTKYLMKQTEARVRASLRYGLLEGKTPYGLDLTKVGVNPTHNGNNHFGATSAKIPFDCTTQQGSM